MSWSYRWYVEPGVGESQKRVALGLTDDNISWHVPVITLNGARRVAPELLELDKPVFDRLWARREALEMLSLRFYRQKPNGAIREVRPRRRAGAKLATRARALKRAKQSAGDPSASDTPF